MTTPDDPVWPKAAPPSPFEEQIKALGYVVKGPEFAGVRDAIWRVQVPFWPELAGEGKTLELAAFNLSAAFQARCERIRFELARAAR